MIGTLIGIIVALIIIGILWYAFTEIIAVLPIAEPMRRIIQVLLIVLAAFIAIWILLQLLGLIGINVSIPNLR